MKNRIPLVLLSFLLFSLSLKSQNVCNVKAVLTPSGDSIVKGYTVVNFESASINADSYRVIIDLYEFGLNTPVNWQIEPGLTTVKLVAYNGSCTDTAVAYYFNPGRFPNATDNVRSLYGQAARDQQISELIANSAGGYTLTGKRLASYYFNEKQEGLLIKTKNEGCVKWAKKLAGSASADITLVEESADNGLFIKTEVDNKHHITKMNTAGDVLWSKSITKQDDNFVVAEMEPLPDGGVILASGETTDKKTSVIRMDSNGNIIWQRDYTFNFNVSSVYRFHNLLYKQNALYIGGVIYSDNYADYSSYIAKLDANTGETIWMKKYTSQVGYVWFLNMVDDGNSIAVGIEGSTGSTTVISIAGIVRLDTAGNIKSASHFTEDYVPNTLVGPYGTGNVELTKSGNTFYLLSNGSQSLSLQPGISYGFKLIKVDSSYNASWVETDFGAGVRMFYHNTNAPNNAVALGGNEVGTAFSPNYLATLLSLKIVDSSGSKTTGDCLFGRQEFSTVPINIDVEIFNPSSTIATYQNIPVNLAIQPFYPEMRFKCPDYVDSCSFLKISGPRSVCNLSDTYTFQAHKNEGCGQPTQWEIPNNVEIISQTGNAVTVRFPAFNRYVIYGTNPLSCNIVQDSIVVIAASKTPPLNLGPDKEICPQNTINISAGSGFYTYKWKDGSTDSVLAVTQPGLYWVEATDSCGNIQKDTINIVPAPPIPFYAGADRIKCNNDTIQLKAPSGFTNYQWSPAYNISESNKQNVTVNPELDTVYTIKAEASPGCYAYDTIRITVFHSPVIDLGNDKTFCFGDSAVFDAGTGFSQYVWSSGQLTAAITTGAQGEYSVIATTDKGCKSMDTVKVLKVYALPIPLLDQNPVLCAGGVRILNPGSNFKDYLWNDGSQSPSITVHSTGHYFVEVTDDNGCKNKADVLIDQVSPLPANFLSADTAICSYGSLTLIPAKNFESYTWNTGFTQKSITINQPGEYILEVVDDKHCTGSDTILVKQKDCLIGLFVPSAFTPNGDGKNDKLKPMLFGNIKKFEFLIYNRWGQVVFRSNTPAEGWDGKVKGEIQGNQLFVWICNYQLDGEEMKAERGTISLIR